MRVQARSLLIGAALLGPLASTACGTDEPLIPKITESDAGPSDAAGDTAPPDAGPLVRTVETRPRFGALDPNNYLLDGDFEYSGPDTVQHPWLGVSYTWFVTGTRCRQGLRCLEIPNRQYTYALGVFVWPDAASVDVEYYAKPNGTGSCTDEVGGLVLTLGEYPGAPQPMSVSATNPERGADGWCHVLARIPVPADTGNSFWTLLLAPRSGATGSILVDDASIRVPSGGAASGSASASGSAPVASAVSEPAFDPLVARARADFAQRPPVPPLRDPLPVKNRTGRRLPHPPR
jgi:hypothetical protein